MFAASAFRKLSSIYVFSYFPFGFEGRIWDLIVSVPDHCLSFYFLYLLRGQPSVFPLDHSHKTKTLGFLFSLSMRPFNNFALKVLCFFLINL